MRETVYLSGVQVRLSDIVSARLDGRELEVSGLHSTRLSGQLEIETVYGTTTVSLDPARLHGKQARSGGAGSVAGDAVLAALSLSNLAGHPERSESAAASRRQCSSALACVDGAALRDLARSMSGALPAWSKLAPAQVAVRLLRDPELFDLARSQVHLGPFPALSELMAAEPQLAVVDRGSEAWRFTTELLSGGRPKARGYTQRVALAAAYPDLAEEMLADSHPLVRAAAYRHAPRQRLLEALTGETSGTARRTAASVLAESLGVPLLPEGPIAGRQSGIVAGRPDLLFVDVDGTLIDGPLVRDEESLASLRAAEAAGVKVVLVTGRTLEELAPLGLGFDLAVADGTFVDLTTMRVLAQGDGRDKGGSVARVCELLGTSSCAAVGDGAVDAGMFEAVRALGGRAGALVSGQEEALAAASDLLGPFGSGGVGRFVERLVSAADAAAAVPALSLASGRTTNYASWQVEQAAFASLLAASSVPEGWRAAHGHVTYAYPERGDVSPLPDPDPDVRLVGFGLVVTDSVAALAVRAERADGTHILQQAGGAPLHLTLATGPSSRGGFVPPSAAGRAVAEALADGTLQTLYVDVPLPALAAPAGTPEQRLPGQLEEAVLAAGAGRDAREWHRLARSAGPELSEHVAAPRPLEAALQASAPLSSGLVVLSGLPASGKSTLAARAAELGAVVVSLDGVRGELNGDEASQERLPDVLAVARARIAAGLTLFPVVSDATNVEARVVGELVGLARSAGVAAVGVPIEVTPEEALARDRARHEAGARSVGAVGGVWDRAAAEQVIGRMADRWERTGGSAGVVAAGLDAVLSPEELLAALSRR